MEVKYSQYNLLKEEEKLLNEEGFITRFLALTRTKKLGFNISVPNNYVVVAKILCDDVTQTRKEDKQYTQSELIEFIFQQYLNEIRRIEPSISEVYQKLITRKEELEQKNGHTLIPSKSRTRIHAKIYREDALKTEALLRSMSHIRGNHGINVEKFIEIVYLDFLSEYEAGRRNNVLKEILEYIEK